MRTVRSWTRLLPWMTGFAAAMALLEAAVVIYLREVYYPGGFDFPLVPIRPRLAWTEVCREVATLVMLLAPGALVTRDRLQRFAWFCYAFAIWDLFYYVFLKLLIDWPDSLFTWDLLFLLPVVWVGPVLAPCIVSLGLIALAWVLLHISTRPDRATPGVGHWCMMVAGAFIVLYTFVEEPLSVMRSAQQRVAGGADGLDLLTGYRPVRFAWTWFLLGCALVMTALIGLLRRPNKRKVAPLET